MCVKVFATDAGGAAGLRAGLEAPKLYDEFLRCLARLGQAGPKQHLERDWSKPHVADPALVQVFERIYEDTATHWREYALCEDLVDLESQFQTWRFRHMRTVMRILGFRSASGRSSGVGFRQQARDVRFLPAWFEGLHVVRTTGLSTGHRRAVAVKPTIT